MLFFAFLCLRCSASNDSLWNIWINPNLEDTTRLNALSSHIQEELMYTNPDSALKLIVVFYNFSKSLQSPIQIAKGEMLFGSCLYVKGDYVRATGFGNKALHNYEAIGDKEGMGAACNLLGNIFSVVGEYDTALKFYSRCLRLRERTKNLRGISASLNNIGILYSDMAEKARDDKNDTLANEYFEIAEEYLLRAIKNSRKIGFERNLSNALINLGLNHHRNNNFDDALKYYSESLVLKEQAEEYQGAAFLHDNIGLVYADKGDYPNAIKYSKLGLEFSQKIGAIHEQSEAAKGLSAAYAKSGNYKDALEMYELYSLLHDSIINDENARAIMEKQFQFDYDRKTNLMKAEQEKESLVSAEKIRRKDLQRNAIAVVLALALLLAGVIFRSYRVKKRDNEFITAQKNEVELKSKDILESIAYAKTLQDAVLPPSRLVHDYFKDSFLIFLPKDVLSGDFYWFERKDDKQYFAIGDCTGHGVPGAMLSVMGLNGLHRCLNELKITDPAAILRQLTDFFQVAFERSEAKVRDGMDLGVCVFDRATCTLTFAGANIPLWVFRKDQIIVLKPDRRPVGYHDVVAEFTQQTLQLEPGDAVYLTTDGYADQLGGPDDRKLKTSFLRTRLAEITGNSMEEQCRLLMTDFEVWKGNGPQTDDVCMLAFRV